MENEVFEDLSKQLLNRIQTNLKQKAETDYATDTDRLYNFHSAGAILGSPGKACLAYATKHFLSIAKLVNDGGPIFRELALEKCGDMATYMVLMYALIMEDKVDAESRSKA